MNRRTALILGLGGAFGLRWLTAQSDTRDIDSTTGESPMLDTKIDTDLNPNPVTVQPFTLPDKEWQSRLSKESYYVLRKEGTERPFTSELNDEKRDGDYACAACGLVLFKASQKFDSGTGWPSFYDAIEGRIKTKTDYKLIIPRTEYHCARCGGHQGHVFKDGPAPTGLRYCNNGVALAFSPIADS